MTNYDQFDVQMMREQEARRKMRANTAKLAELVQDLADEGPRIDTHWDEENEARWER